ncbi:YfiR family protein [Nitrosomonas oligotropha]|uniref:YfiR family protein n=1 Tax=Nitrosomonas oligotropha TaxID=42354 RepID=UPI00136F8CD8|nr:YfiR family protein [Nitrosomonas oligotropha]MXS82855.1 YfiR family protein [Nitrosomonas oligotropha]
MRFLHRLLRLPDNPLKRSIRACLFAVLLGYGLPAAHSPVNAGNVLEYQVKAAFIYNFIAFTQWPVTTGPTINLCVYGEDFFGSEIDKLQSKPVDKRHIKVVRITAPEKLADCQVIFFSKSVSGSLSSLLMNLPGQPILTLADSPNAISHGIMINMNLVNEKIIFEINLGIVRQSGLDISSKLLQLATKVHQ